MSDQYANKLFSPITLGINLAWTGSWFAFFTFILRDFVPFGEGEPMVRLFWAAFTATPITGVFFFVGLMFTAVLADQRQDKKAEA